MTKPKTARIRADDITPGRARGGELRIVLGPGTVGSRSGYMGTGILQPGERVVEHFHTYSEEFLYCVREPIFFPSHEHDPSPGRDETTRYAEAYPRSSARNHC